MNNAHSSEHFSDILPPGNPIPRGSYLPLFARNTAPGLGYGRCWNKGPEAVESTPVFASPERSRPADQPPLGNIIFTLNVLISEVGSSIWSYTCEREGVRDPSTLSCR